MEGGIKINADNNSKDSVVQSQDKDISQSQVNDAQVRRNNWAINNYINRNMQEAQREYDEEMQSHSSIDVGGVRLKNGTAERIGHLTEQIGIITLSTVENNVIPNDASGREIKMAMRGVSTFISLNPLNVSSHISAKFSYRQDMMAHMAQTALSDGEIRKNIKDFYTSGNSARIKLSALEEAIVRDDYARFRRLQLSEINRVLSSHGYAEIPRNLSGEDLEKYCQKNIERFRKKNIVPPKEVIDALNTGVELGKSSFYEKKCQSGYFRRNFLRLTTSTLSYGGEGGRMTARYIDMSSKVTGLTRFAVRNFHNGMRVTRLFAQKNIIEYLKRKKNDANNKRYASNINKAIKYDKKMRSSDQSDKFQRKRDKKIQKADKIKGRVNKKQKKQHFTRTKEWFKNTKTGQWFEDLRDRRIQRKNNTGIRKLRRKYNEWSNRASDSVIGKIVNKILSPFRSISKVFSKIAALFTKIIGAIILIYIIMIIILMIVSYVYETFNFANASKKDVVVGYLNTLYQNDLKYMVYCYPGYTIEFNDIRNQKEYSERLELEKKNNEEDEVWLQSTNCAEIISMMWTNYEYTFDNASEDNLKSFVEGLYYGSHEIAVNKASKRIIFTTYYFDELFSRKPRSGIAMPDNFESLCPTDQWQDEMLHSPEVAYKMSVGVLTGTEKEVYDTLIQEGFTNEAAAAVMANIYAESGFKYDIHGSNDAYGLYQFDPGESGDAMNPSEGSTMYGYMSYIGATPKNFKKKDSAAKQTEYMLKGLELAFISSTGQGYVYSYGIGQTTDVSEYHVWAMASYTISEFKAWNSESKLRDELIKDYLTHGDKKMTAKEVAAYINSLTDNEKSVAYATLLFTRVYEKPSTNDWISQRVKKAIEYYHFIGGYSGGIRTVQENPLTYFSIRYNPEVRKWYSGHGSDSVNPFVGDNGLDKFSGDRGGNCTAYAWGRRAEMEGGTGLGAMGDANAWYDREVAAGVYRCSNTDPVQPGAVVVWDYDDHICGHVAIVEKVNEDGSIIISDSKYGSHDGIPELFRSWTIGSEAELKTWAGNFIGYIYIDKL